MMSTNQLQEPQLKPPIIVLSSHTKQPLVSICISAYNVERVVSAALSSVLNQTYQNLEVIVLDNGSTDGTADALRSIGDQRVRTVAAMPNIGGYQGMNKAIGLAQGELVAVYHSDDIYEPTIVAKEVAYLQSHPQAGAVFAMDHYMDDDGTIFGGTDLPVEFVGREMLGYKDVFPYLLRNKNILFRCPTFMARRKALDTVGLFDPETFDIGSDTEMWLRMARRYPIGILSERLIRYRVGQRQWSSRYNRLRTEEERHFFVMDYYLAMDHWREKLSADDLREYTFHRCDDETFRAANFVIQRKPDEARSLLRRRYPLATFLANTRRRKLRVLLLRTLMKFGLRIGAIHPLRRLLIWTEYQGRL